MIAISSATVRVGRGALGVPRCFCRLKVINGLGMRYDKALRRLWAIFLLTFLGVSLISPAVSADSDSNLPACCRRFGKHHCSVSVNPSSGPTVRSAVCPSFPGAAAPGIVRGAFGLILTASLFFLFVSRPLPANVVRGAAWAFLGGSHRKRGPPISSAFA